jgi:hypothetical protein
MDTLLSHDLLPGHAADTRRWNDRVVAMTALLMGFDDAAAATDRFAAARACVVEMFPGRKRPGLGFNGFVKALKRFSDERLPDLHGHLRVRMKGLLGQQWSTADGRGNDWVVMAADGSRVDAPDTAANEEGLGAAGREKSGPQVQLTAVFHLASGVPWCWRCSSVREGERTHLEAMADLLPPRTLLVTDAGFAGYTLVKRLTDGGTDVLMRVGGNVRLLTGLGCDWRQDGSTVYLWPKGKQAEAERDLKAGRAPAEAAPLVMRLVVLHERVGRRRKTVYLLTNVRCRRRLSDARAGRIYRQRWVAETAYRGFKETMERRKVCSRTPERALLELEWAMLAMWLLGLLSAGPKARCGRDVGAWSVAASLRVMRGAMARPWRKSPNGGVLGELRRAAKDDCKRTSSKQARRRRDKKRDRPPGPPKARKATRAEKALAQRIIEQKRAA